MFINAPLFTTFGVYGSGFGVYVLGFRLRQTISATNLRPCSLPTFRNSAMGVSTLRGKKREEGGKVTQSSKSRQKYGLGCACVLLISVLLCAFVPVYRNRIASNRGGEHASTGCVRLRVDLEDFVTWKNSIRLVFALRLNLGFRQRPGGWGLRVDVQWWWYDYITLDQMRLGLN